MSIFRPYWWLYGLRRRYAVSWLLRSLVRIPLSVCSSLVLVVYCVGTGLNDELITIFLYFQLDTLFSVYVQYLLTYFPLHVSGLTGPSSGGLNCTCSLWYSPPLQMLCRTAVENGRTTKTSAEGENTIGCMYNLDLLVMGLWGLKRVEESRIADIVRRRKTVYQVGNKEKWIILRCTVNKISRTGN